MADFGHVLDFDGHDSHGSAGHGGAGLHGSDHVDPSVVVKKLAWLHGTDAQSHTAEFYAKHMAGTFHTPQFASDHVGFTGSAIKGIKLG